MGRPPIGERAMTEAERKRRQRALLRASKPVTKPTSREHAALAKELAQAKATIAELDARGMAIANMGDNAIAALKKKLAWARAELAQAKARIAELEKLKGRQRRKRKARK